MEGAWQRGVCVFPPQQHALQQGKESHSPTLLLSATAGWQSTPVVNIFKLCDVENKKNVELSGKVALRMVSAAVLSNSADACICCALLDMTCPHSTQDEVIHRKVFKITGSIPAVNFLKLPKEKALGLAGRFLYLQVG